MKHITLFFAIFIVLFVIGCGVGERDISVENCGEPIDITECKWKGQLFTCVIKNTGDATFMGVPVWRYDKDHQQLEKSPYRYAAGLKPGERTRQKLPVTKYGKDSTAKIIFCRTDPEELFHGSKEVE